MKKLLKNNFKINIIISIILNAVIMVGLLGCNKIKNCDVEDRTNLGQQSLENTNWKLVGFVDMNSCKMRKAKPGAECEECFILQFTDKSIIELDLKVVNYVEDKIFYGFTTANVFIGGYYADYVTGTFRIYDFNLTKVGEYYDGMEYWEIFHIHKINSFYLKENELRLYYNDKKNYLLYKTQEL